MTASTGCGDLNDIQPPDAVHPHARTLPRRRVSLLFAEDLAPTAGTLRTAQRWLAAWAALAFPRVVRLPRVDAEGRAIGGVRLAVDAGDYDALCSGTVRETAEAA